MRRWLVLSALLLSMGLAVPGCTVNPATGRRQFNPLSPEEEVNIGNKAAPEFLAEYGGEIPSPEIRRYVSDLGHRLAEVSERPELPWEFFVVDSSVLNAFAIPGGKVFISRGLLEKMTNEAQLAGVLGHEIGHVTAQHIGQQMGRAMGVQVLGAALGVAGQMSESDALTVLGVGTQVGGGLYLLRFGRSQESEADRLGLRYMTRLGYHPKGQLQVMQILADAAEGQGRPPEFLSTHPYPEDRIKEIRQIIRKEYPNADRSGRFTYGEADFQRYIMQPLRNLPPPRHPGQQQRGG